MTRPAISDIAQPDSHYRNVPGRVVRKLLTAMFDLLKPACFKAEAPACRRDRLRPC